MTVYLDNQYCCHVAPVDGLRAVETEAFNGRCEAFIEGYRFVPEGEAWISPEGVSFAGQMMAPWKDYTELDAAQREYERQQLVEANATITELDAALLEATYNNLTGGD